MQRRTKYLTIGAAVTVAAAGLGVGAVAASSGGDDDGTEVPITGAAYDTATAAALAHTGEGTVTETEAGDEEGAYEVEITLDDGSQVDVHLDENFDVLGAQADQPGEDDTD